MVAIPTGVVTFLFTDIEGSTRTWQDHPAAMQVALVAHDQVVRTEIERHDGHVFSTGGDGFGIAFGSPAEALGAAASIQREVGPRTRDVGLELKVRMGAHTGASDERGGDYFGPTVNRAARLMAIAHGGQVVVSALTAGLDAALPRGTVLADRGWHRLKDLADPEQVFELVLEGTPAFPPLRSLPVAQHNLPVARTSFVGRNDEVASLAGLVIERPLVTVLAPGGMGKTRLSVEVGRRAVDSFPQGVWFVDLAAVSDPGDVPAAVSAALQLPMSLGATPDVARLGAQLADWHCLVILDNCEHVIDAAGELADDLLTGCPDLRVLATSRIPLDVPGEQRWPLASLAAQISGDQGGAVQLFVERARLADPTFTPDAKARTTIAELCERLDGSPLAIELAAARLSTAGLRELMSVVETPIALTGSPRAGRHQSLHSVIEWSHELLSDRERTALRRLSVFTGGCTLVAAEEVVSGEDLPRDDVASAVLGLVDQSLLVADRGSTTTRYRLLETIRAFAADALREAGEHEALRERHTEWYAGWSAALARDVAAFGWTRDPSEIANQDAALRWSLEHRDTASTTSFLADAMGALITDARGMRVVADVLEVVRSESPEPDWPGREAFDRCNLVLAEIGGDFARSGALAEHLRATTSDDTVWWGAMLVLGHHRSIIDPRAATEIYDEMDGRFGTTPMTIYGRGAVALTEQRFSDAVASIFEAFAVRDLAGLADSSDEHPPDIVALIDLVCGLLLDGRADEAQLVAETVTVSGGDALFEGPYAALVESIVAAGRTDRVRAVERLDAAITLLRARPTPVAEYDTLLGAVLVAELSAAPAVAAEALGTLRGGFQRCSGLFALRRQAARRLRHELGGEAYEAAIGRGASTPVAAALDAVAGALGLGVST